MSATDHRADLHTALRMLRDAEELGFPLGVLGSYWDICDVAAAWGDPAVTATVEAIPRAERVEDVRLCLEALETLAAPTQGGEQP